MIEQSSSQSTRKLWLWLCITINVGFLGIFKYYNFFAESFAALLSTFGWHSSPLLLQVILPVGISFYTFHGLSYSIDIYYGRIKSEKTLSITLFSYVIFRCWLRDPLKEPHTYYLK